jgi:hypothetical protein
VVLVAVLGVVGVAVALVRTSASAGGEAAAGPAASSGSVSTSQAGALLTTAADAADGTGSFVFESTSQYTIESQGSSRTGGWRLTGRRVADRSHVLAVPNGAEQQALGMLADLGSGISGDPAGGLEVVITPERTYWRFAEGSWTSDPADLPRTVDVGAVVDVVRSCEPQSASSQLDGTRIECRLPPDAAAAAVLGHDLDGVGEGEATMTVTLDGQGRLTTVVTDVSGTMPEGTLTLRSTTELAGWGDQATIDVPVAVLSGGGDAAGSPQPQPQPSAAPSSPAPPPWVTYANERFEFSLTIPGSLQPTGSAANGDGQRFVSADGRGFLTVSGSNNVDGLTAEEVLAERRAALVAEGADFRYEDVEGQLVSLSGYVGDDIFYDRLAVGQGSVVSVEWRYPKTQREEYDAPVETSLGSLRADGLSRPH